MSKLKIMGGKPLHGELKLHGAKNASLPIMASALLTEGPTQLSRVPRLTDVRTLRIILERLGMRVHRTDHHSLNLEVMEEENCTCPHEPAIAMRASICVLGPLVAKRGFAEVPLPGGCVIGERPVDLHLRGLRALGADIEQKNGYIRASASGLEGNRIYMGGPHGSTVLGTANVMMAATLAEGRTVVEHAASEPEVQDLAHYLNSCGANIEGAGTNTVTIEGVNRLEGTPHKVIPDRIEAGTFACAVAITGGDVLLEGARSDHLSALLNVMRKMGVEFEQSEAGIRVRRTGELQGTDFTALPYPGIPTDMQPQLMAVLVTANGTSVVTDSVHPERFTHVGELHRLGADIVRQGPQAVVRGPVELSGAPVTARDLRGGASLIVAGLAAGGTTTVDGMSHVDRGYERIEGLLRRVDARVKRQGAPPFEVGQLHLPFHKTAS
ncbi:MAG: UDP-N-acetylglucosamine 1-carboxyvinyltransferase [Planctomycetota bacterium]